MEVMAPMDAKPSRWNDDRLDEFAVNVDKRFDRVDQHFDQVDKRLDRVDGELARVNDRLDDLMKVLIVGFIGLIGVIIAGVITLVATQL
jgi:uncharacterized protein YPO0396